MKKTNIITSLLIIAIAVTMLTIPAFAASGNVDYPTSNRVTISGGTASNVYYCGVTSGSAETTVLKFTNESTGNYYTYTFYCDGSYHNKTVNIDPGTYKITVVYAAPHLLHLYMNFS